jgi:hypothetical protein
MSDRGLSRWREIGDSVKSSFKGIPPLRHGLHDRTPEPELPWEVFSFPSPLTLQAGLTYVLYLDPDALVLSPAERRGLILPNCRERRARSGGVRLGRVVVRPVALAL